MYASYEQESGLAQTRRRIVFMNKWDLCQYGGMDTTGKNLCSFKPH